MRAELLAKIDAELRLPVDPAVRALGAELAARAGEATAAVLFYGSGLRDTRLDGVLDFYVLLDDVGAWPGSRLARTANRLLPPNVAYLETDLDGRRLRAKVAIMSLAQFQQGTAGDGLDTTLWARFSQPCRCVFARSNADHARLTEAVAQAVATAARWAALLGPESERPEAFWRALYTRTYGAELRVERDRRSHDLVGSDTERYAGLLPVAWMACNLRFDTTRDGRILPRIEPRERRRAERRWARREKLGKPLNLVRLLKAACTFDGAADYVAWKVERHSGVQLELKDWQRRHPLLAAPGVYMRLRRRGVLR